MPVTDPYSLKDHRRGDFSAVRSVRVRPSGEMKSNSHLSRTSEACCFLRAASARLGQRSASEPKEAFCSGISHASKLRDCDRKPKFSSILIKLDYGNW